MTPVTEPATALLPRLRWVLLALGIAGAVAAAAADPDAGRTAFDQDWPPFVLVVGLLLLGQVAWADGLFHAAGRAMGRRSRTDVGFLLLAAGAVACTTAVLNLDTSVAFLTPILVYAARRRGGPEAPVLYLSLFLANGASLLLPGSNLTNVIVLGAHPIGGLAFARRMLAPWVAAVVVVTAGTGLLVRRGRSEPTEGSGEGNPPPRILPALPLVVAAVVAMLLLPVAWMAAAVAAGGVVGLAAAAGQRRLPLRWAVANLNLPLLGALMGVAVAIGALGVAWSGPAHLVASAGPWGSSALAAGLSDVVNNLPAASLLSARHPGNPWALLVGLDLGPNLVVTGALAGVLWLQVARAVGARPSPAEVSRLGALLVPASMVCALAALHFVP